MQSNSKVNYLDIKEFREAGYLQEVNRNFFHPLGLALEIKQDDDGTMTLGGIWDYRDDPEGMVFGEPMDTDKAQRIATERIDKARARQEKFGWIIQPVDDWVSRSQQ